MNDRSSFDVVPTDCMAAHLKRRLPDATRLTLAFQALDLQALELYVVD